MTPSEKTVSLRQLATQNHYAARVIQALARGHLCRRELWSYQGILTVATVIKIQRVWRGYLGRRRAAHRYLEFVRQKREIIRGLCRCWKARRILRIKRAEFLNRTATTLQCAYRSRASRKYFEELKRKALERMATRLQKTIRGFVCRRWVFRLWSLADVTLVELKRVIHEDIVVANSITHRMTLQSFTLSDLQHMRSNLRRSSVTFLSRPVSPSTTTPDSSRPPSPTLLSSTHPAPLLQAFTLPPPWGPNTEKWRSLHLSLGQLVGTNRPEFAIDLLSILLHQHPTFLPAAFSLLCSYLYSWCSGGTTGARLVREDYLEESLGIMLRLQEAQRRAQSTHFPCALLNAELATFVGEETRESDFLVLLEKTYFWNGFRAAGCNARTMSLMASFVLASQFPEFGVGYASFMIGHGGGVGRARRLMNRVRDCAAYREAETVALRLQILENVFESPHESVLKHRVGMRDLQEDTGEQREGLAKVTSVDLECFRAGEMLLVTGKIAAPRLATTAKERDLSVLTKLERVREQNRAKWSLPGNESILTVRPLILLSSEVEQIYSASVKYFAHSTGKPEQEILMKPKWRTLSEFVSQSVRLVSCGRGRFVDERKQQGGDRSSVPLVSGVRLVLPSIEYRRQERNSLRIESHCAKLIQRAFRGFQGRSLWRRLHLRILEEKRQRAELSTALQRSSKLRAARYFQISLIQSRVKGWIHRRRLNVMRLAALRIQCLARCRQARLRVRHEKMRKSLGPEVIEMLRRVVSVSGHTLTVVVYRCGGSYKIVGFDGVQSRQYVGYVYEPQVNSILAEHNQQFQGDSKAIQSARVMPWQHSRVIEVLLECMSLSTPIASLTRELGGSKTKMELVFIAKRGLTGGGIDSTPSRRVLVDQAMIVRKYDELMALKEERDQKERRKKNRLKYL